MFYGNHIQQTRALFFSSWKKYKNQDILTPLEKQIADVIIEHPEYHALLENPEQGVEKEFFAETGQTNPFLHMGLHLAIRDQVRLDSPKGFRKLFEQLMVSLDYLAAEHIFMELLAETIWQAQRSQTMPDEQQYLRLCEQKMKQLGFK